MGGKQLKLLATKSDLETLEPILGALKEKGFRIKDAGGRGHGMVLAVLSEQFYGDKEAVDALLALIAQGAERVLPLQLDAAPVPDVIKNALYSRNIIPAGGREASLIAERIMDAMPKRKDYLPAILIAGGAVLLAICGAILWYYTSKPKDTEPEEVVASSEEPEPEKPLPGGLTEADLAKVRIVIIIGDEFHYYVKGDYQEGAEPMESDLATRIDADGESRWISNEDGHTYSMTHYDDLSFIGKMRNLERLSLINVEVDADKLPQLSLLWYLMDVYVSDCNIDNLDWMSGGIVRTFAITGTPVKDYSVINQCKQIANVEINLQHVKEADLSGFGPNLLKSLSIHNGTELENGIDLGGLQNCGLLYELGLNNMPVRDLEFLRDRTWLRFLYLLSCDQLTDASAIGTLTNLTYLRMEYCNALRDYTPIGECKALEKLELHCDGNSRVFRDASFLSDMPALRDIGLWSIDLRDLNFLEGIAQYQNAINLGFSGQIDDYSGLRFIKRYDFLHMNPRYDEATGSRNASLVLPYLKDAQIGELQLCGVDRFDLKDLPDNLTRLGIEGGDWRTLKGLKPYALSDINICNCQYLTSLEGLEAVSTLYDGSFPNLRIENCPRLRDYSALDGAGMACLTIGAMDNFPDFGKFTTRKLRLERIPGMTDLRFLSTFGEQRYLNIELVDLEDLSDISALSDFWGQELRVPPQVAEQAKELVKAGNFGSYEVQYPEGGWQPNDNVVELLSLEDLEMLSPSALKRVDKFGLVGDTFVPLEYGNVEWYFDDEGEVSFWFHYFETDERVPIERGEGIMTDLSLLSDLTGLHMLCLYDQPLENLSGIQEFANLESLEVGYCRQLTDVSAVFACPSLQELSLRNLPITSIQGIQNLMDLYRLDLGGDRELTDLKPLLSLDRLEYVLVSGEEMREAIDSLEGEEYPFYFDTQLFPEDVDFSDGE